jgi:hypothetical protein
MPASLDLLDAVALLLDKPDDGLVQGQVGTIVEVLQDGQFLVEFSDDRGEAYAIIPLPAQALLRLQFAAEAAE